MITNYIIYLNTLSNVEKNKQITLIFIFLICILIICGILYRIAFASFFAISMPKIPLLQNLYMNRQYPLKNLLKK